MATLRCNCGKTAIKLATTQPRSQTVCCCGDCFDRFDVLHKHFNGPKSHPPNLPALFDSYDNSLVVESGDVMFFKVTALDRPSPINMASTCCHTYMMGYFEPYHHNCVAVRFQLDIYCTTRPHRPQQHHHYNAPDYLAVALS